MQIKLVSEIDKSNSISFRVNSAYTSKSVFIQNIAIKVLSDEI